MKPVYLLRERDVINLISSALREFKDHDFVSSSEVNQFVKEELNQMGG